MDLRETDEQQLLRTSVAAMAGKYGHGYFLDKARSGGKTTELWKEAGENGYLGVAVPAEYGGGGAGMVELSIVAEEIAAAGCPLLLIVVSPAIAATVIATSGTADQKQRWLPRFADGTAKMSFAITEPDAGSNSHNITTTARRDPSGGWRLSGTKYYISGVDETEATLVVTRLEGAPGKSTQGTLRPAMFIVPTDTPGVTYQPIEMATSSPEKQFTVYFDDALLPEDALVGGEEAGLSALFAGLNPERITVAAYSNGLARYALRKGTEYAKDRTVWKPRSAATRRSRTRSRRRTWRWSWPGWPRRGRPGSTTPGTTEPPGKRPTSPSTRPPRPPSAPSTPRCRPTVATAWPSSTGWER